MSANSPTEGELGLRMLPCRLEDGVRYVTLDDDAFEIPFRSCLPFSKMGGPKPVGEVVEMDGMAGPLYDSPPCVVALVLVLSEKNSPPSEGVVRVLELPGCDCVPTEEFPVFPCERDSASSSDELSSEELEEEPPEGRRLFDA